MNFERYYEVSPSQVNFNSSYRRGESNKIPWSFIFLYLFLSLSLCYLYHKKIVSPADWSAPNSINAVSSFETAKPYQFRLLIPLLFLFFKPLASLYGKYLFSAYNTVVIFALLVIYNKLLCRYFINKKLLLWLAPVIFYPIMWNYLILNSTFQYYDFTAILMFTMGLYFIIKENFMAFVITFAIGILNKESAVYLVFAYLLFNYRSVFTFKIIIRTLILAVIMVCIKAGLSYIFRDNPGGTFEIGYDANKEFIKSLFSNRLYMKSVFLNFGGMYIFTVLLFITGAWKKFPDRRLIMLNLAVIPYYILGIYFTYIIEVRVYTELIPMITTLFLVYLSGFKRLNLQPVNKSE